jgi:uncharacterized protein YciI
MRNLVVALLAGAALLTGAAQAQSIALPQTDAELAKALGGNDNGMRNYVMVLLRTGPKRMPDGPDRNKMFEGHFANIERLAKEKKMVLAGPLDGVDGLRGVFIFATDSIDEARQWVATDPVIASGEMVGEFHKFFASAAVMAIPQIHDRIRKK